MDYYGNTSNYIHLKFGDMRKNCNFTEAFQAKHPLFVKEYFKYFESEESLFNDPLEIVNYVEMYGLKVNFYFNMTDTPAKDFDDVRAYLNREHVADIWNYKHKNNIEDSTSFAGIDGEERVSRNA